MTPNMASMGSRVCTTGVPRRLSCGGDDTAAGNGGVRAQPTPGRAAAVHRGCEPGSRVRPARTPVLHKFHGAYDEDEDLCVPDLRELLPALRAVDDDPRSGA